MTKPIDNAQKPILTVRDLSVSFRNRHLDGRESIVDVVQEVDFELYRGETVALVGESGSGKSLTALSILQLLNYPQAFHPSGSITYNGVQLLGANERQMRQVRGNDISMVFQEPMTALNPLHRIEKQITESLALHQGITGSAAREKVIELLEQVGIKNAQSRLNAYPHELSGGQRQRVMIAVALANKPSVLLADEPTTALDVTVQARILQLLKDLQHQEQLAILLIAHDLNLVRKFADRVLVMQNGRLLEAGTTEKIFTAATHPYTQKLLASEPPPRKAPDSKVETILTAENMRVWFPIKKGLFKRTVDHVKAVDDITLSLKPGYTLGVVGESGSGKSTLVMALLNLVKATGNVSLDGKSVDWRNKKMSRQYRRDMQIVFQDPYGSLSPRMTISDIVSEGLLANGLLNDAKERDDAVCEILQQVDVEPANRFRYPHEFSGGQRQRIAIARALILRPRILFLDEPTSALDRTVQVQVLELLNRLQSEKQLAYVFISHDLSVIRAIADDVLVIRDGKVVEYASAVQIFNQPQQMYTKQLMAAAFDMRDIEQSIA